MDPYKILKYPHMTEKSIGLVERENKLVFITVRKATKDQIRKAFEEAFNVEVESINTLITRNGEKKAFIKLKPKYHAADIAVRLGII